MYGQLDLWPGSGLKVRPERGRAEPRLWVRRLAIWAAPGVPVREIALRPGLNIVWSPDPADRGQTPQSASALGHGSGKTLLCRLLRYVLGEERFSPDEQRFRIAAAFPEGTVGAEVMLDGTPWAVLRPIGNTRQHYAIPNAGLEQLLAGKCEATGIEPFLKAMEQRILSRPVVALMPVERPLQAWPVTLAWLARDQECRFDKPLDWRSVDSDSDSLVRGWSLQQRQDAVRALIGAIDPEEYRLRGEIPALDARQKDAEQESARQAWEADRLRARLIAELGLNPESVVPGRLGLESLRRAAKEGLARLAMGEAEADKTDIESLRSQAKQAAQTVEDLKQSLTQIETRIPIIEALIRRIEGTLPSLSVEIDKREAPLCPICDVPIDRALAEGCQLSHRLPDTKTLTERLEETRRDLQVHKSSLGYDREERTRLAKSLEDARSRADTLSQRVALAERRRDERSDAWFEARRAIDDAERLERLLLDWEETHAIAKSLLREIERRRERIGGFRDAQSRVFDRLSGFFDAIVRELVGPSANGRVTLDGNGLNLSLQLGGERSTAAIDSLKVIAFDLAALCMSIAGDIRVPAFLIHDSPREADLGLSVYHRLFQMALELEQVGARPLFQYIVTTTTPPPQELQQAPWLGALLGGSPAAERLMRRDL